MSTNFIIAHYQNILQDIDRLVVLKKTVHDYQ